MTSPSQHKRHKFLLGGAIHRCSASIGELASQQGGITANLVDCVRPAGTTPTMPVQLNFR